MSGSDLLSGNFCVMPQFIVCTVVYQFNYSSLITKLLIGPCELAFVGNRWLLDGLCLSFSLF